eukprot:753662-Hanusia_phi.AAC.1
MMMMIVTIITIITIAMMKINRGDYDNGDQGVDFRVRISKEDSNNLGGNGNGNGNDDGDIGYNDDEDTSKVLISSHLRTDIPFSTLQKLKSHFVSHSRLIYPIKPCSMENAQLN